MQKRQKVPGSTRADGQASVAVSIPTRNMLKQLAGDMPVSEYLKAMAIRELGGQVPLPGQESAVSKATIHSVAADMEVLKSSYSNIELAICKIGDKLGIRLNTGINREKVASAAAQTEFLLER